MTFLMSMTQIKYNDSENGAIIRLMFPIEPIKIQHWSWVKSVDIRSTTTFRLSFKTLVWTEFFFFLEWCGLMQTHSRRILGGSLCISFKFIYLFTLAPNLFFFSFFILWSPTNIFQLRCLTASLQSKDVQAEVNLGTWLWGNCSKILKKSFIIF